MRIKPHGFVLIGTTALSPLVSLPNSDVSTESMHARDWKISDKAVSARSSRSSSLRALCSASEKFVQAAMGVNRRPSHVRSIQEQSLEYIHGAARTNGRTMRALTHRFRYASGETPGS